MNAGRQVAPAVRPQLRTPHARRCACLARPGRLPGIQDFVPAQAPLHAAHQAVELVVGGSSGRLLAARRSRG